MASTYTPLGVELQATGENAGTWGTKTNTNLQILEQISGGYIAKSIAGGAQTTALAVSDGSTGAELSHRMIEFTGTITGNQIVTIPLDVQTFYFLRNSTSGAYTVQFKYASGSGDSFTFSATDKGDAIVFATASDSTNPNIDTIALGISNIVEDTTPQLGGNLDTNDNNIVTTSNRDINLYANGTGAVEIGGNDNPGTLILNCENNSHGIRLISPAHSASQSYQLKFPTNNCTAGTFLKVESITGSGTTAVGQLSFDSSPATTGKAIAMAIVFG